MTAAERQVYDRPEPCGCYAEGYAAAKGKAHFEVWPAWTSRLMPRIRLLVLSGEAGLPVEGHDPTGQDVARAIRPGGGLGLR